MKTKEELEARKKEIEFEKLSIEAELKHLDLPENMRKEFETGFGWPRISQSLMLKDKLDEELYDKLFKEVQELVYKIAKMVPAWKDSSKPCENCHAIKSLLK